MEREIGKPTNCPSCNGSKKVGTRTCPVCDGEGRVEYQERDGYAAAPAGAWFPLRRRGLSGYIICLFGNKIQGVTR